MKIKKLLIIGATFPEPTTTAAGVRMLQLIALFQEEGFQITFASTAKTSEYSYDLQSLKIRTSEIELNNSSFDTFIKDLNPQIVMFDRFTSEEQFGWRVAECCPNAMRILDTEDLHFLRLARAEAIKNGERVEDANIFSDTAKREIASILRCDLSLIISEFEMRLLQQKFNVPQEILHYLPFLVSSITSEERDSLPTFEERTHFVCIGNTRHAPNKDAVLHLKTDIWPKIREQLPKAELHVYGAYQSQQIMELHNPRDGFIIEGWAPHAAEVFKNARVCLAPLRFGAGLKGKILDGMLSGTPCITTNIGAEGMDDGQGFSGGVANDVTEFVELSVRYYSEKEPWLLAQQNGFRILENRFKKTSFSEAFKNRIQQIASGLDRHRNTNFIGQVLLHQTLQSTKYMSKWIEAKNKRI